MSCTILGYCLCPVSDLSASQKVPELYMFAPGDFCTNTPVAHAVLDAAYEAAKKDQSLVLLVFRAQNCIFSKAFYNHTLKSEIFLNADLKVHYIILDVDKHKNLTREFSPRFLPESFVLTHDGKIIDRQRGLIEPEQLITWIRQAEKKAAKGEWINYSSTGEFGTFLEKFKSGRPLDTDYKKLIDILGNKNVKDRAAAEKVIKKQFKQVMPYLIDAVADPFLATRVKVQDLLKKVIPHAPDIHPWASKPERKKDLDRLQTWWDKVKHEIIITATKPETVSYDLLSVQQALNKIVSDNASDRTKAMTMLVEMGIQTLPAIKNKIASKQREKDYQALATLKHVKWAILISPEIEQTILDIKNTLEGNNNRNRLAVIEQLGNIGEAALPVLFELLSEEDPLIQEEAVLALAKIKSQKIVPHMAKLLKSTNPNLRMTAAQLLGQSEWDAATPFLVKALSDPDEIVVLTALAALEELKSQDIDQYLIACLKDKRWRVRAKSAETIGKMEVFTARNTLNELLMDRDPFVIKSALTALSELSFTPEPETLKQLIINYPDLIKIITTLILDHQCTENIQIFSDLFSRIKTRHKIDFLNVLTEAEKNFGKDHKTAWDSVFQKIFTSPDKNIRQKAVIALPACSFTLASKFALSLLKDKQLSVRQAAQNMILLLICNHYGFESYRSLPQNGLMIYYKKHKKETKNKNKEAEEKIIQAKAIIDLYKTWNSQLIKEKDEKNILVREMILFLTDKTQIQRDEFIRGFTEQQLKLLFKKEYGQFSLELLMSRMPWPEASSTIKTLMANPYLYCALISSFTFADPQLIKVAMDSDKLFKNLTKIKTDGQKLIANAFLAPMESHAASLFKSDNKTKKIVKKLVNADEPFLKTLGITAAQNHPEILKSTILKLCSHGNAWVRRAAVMTLDSRVSDLVNRESFLSRLIVDKHPEVKKAVIHSLLAKDIRKRIYLYGSKQSFKFDGIELELNINKHYDAGPRPLSVINRNPVFLKHVKTLYHQKSTGTGSMLSLKIALILAQYGKFDELTIEVEKWFRKKPLSDPELPLLIGIALSKNTDYLPILTMYMNQENDASDLRKLLNAVWHFKGNKVKLFRQKLNKQLRVYAQ